MRTIWQDFLRAIRVLRKSPGFSLTAVFALAAGIGASSAIFSLVDAALLRPLPFRAAGRLVAVSERPPGFLRNSVSAPTYLDWRDQNNVFEKMGAMAWSSRTLTGEGAPERITGQQFTASYFETLGVQPIAGRIFTAAEERQPLAVISRRLWMRRFGGDPGVLGRAITLDNERYTICGVLPASFQVIGDVDLWTPLPLDRAQSRRDMHNLFVIARLKPDVTLARAGADMDVIAARIGAEAPRTNAGWGVTIDPLQAYLAGTDLRTTSLALFGAVGFLLLLSCVNVANLTMVRGARRAREIAVRQALGASRARIVLQLLAESLTLALAGGAVGLWIAGVLLDAAPHILPPGAIPAAIALHLDGRVALFALAASICTGLLFGMAPAWLSSSANLNDALRSSGRAVTAGGRIRALLAGGEIALAVILVAGAGLLVRTLLRLEQTDRGYEPGNVLTMRFSLSPSQYPVNQPPVAFFEAAEREIAALPGVRSAGFSVDLPLEGWSFGEPFEIAGKPMPPAARVFAHFQLASPRYFETVGIRFSRGRAFNERDSANSTPVCIINEELARRFFEGRDPIGAMITTAGAARQVAGVIHQVKVQNPADAAALEIYVPYTQSWAGGLALSVRTAGDPLAMTKAVQAVMARVDKDLALTQVRTLDEIAEQSVVRPRFRAALAASFALTALALAALGVYGVLAFAVAQRVKEFGIRMALGATSEDILALVLRDGLRIALGGMLAGLPAAAILSRFLATLLYGVRPLDPLTFIAVPLALTFVALAASAIPARRAMGVDPAIALHDE